MAIIIIALWMLLLHVLVKVKVIKQWNVLMKASPAIIYLMFLLVVAIPMNFMAPKGKVIVLRETAPISAQVSGQVKEVLVDSNRKVFAGETLFKLEDTPYVAEVDRLNAQLRLAEIRLNQAKELIQKGAGREADVETYQAEYQSLGASLNLAKWQLNQTIVTSPTSGIIPHVALEPGEYVTTTKPVMSIVDSSRFSFVATIAQNYARHIEVGQTADIVLKLFPGKTFKANVIKIVQQAKGGQIKTSGSEFDTENIEESPFSIVLSLDFEQFDEQQKVTMKNLPAGSFGTAVIYTQEMQSIGELIQAIMLRTETWINYI